MSNKKNKQKYKKKKHKQKKNKQTNKKPNTRQLSDIYNWYIGHKR